MSQRLKFLKGGWEIPQAARPEDFERMLALECRRCERTGGRFGLVVIDLGSLEGSPPLRKVDQIAHSIRAVMRETDITGRYESLETVGVILTTLNDAGQGVLEEIVVGKIREVLSAQLSTGEAARVPVSFHLFPDDDGGSRARPPERTFSPGQERTGKNKVAAGLKRTLDISGSLAALVVLSPAFLIISILIRLTSPGPVFFRQTRVGQSGRRFTFLKFRSMYADSDPQLHKRFVSSFIDGGEMQTSGVYKLTDDPRITLVGRFLRKTSLDELPQFLNVLRGDMSLVGPRPPIPYELERYSRWHLRRIQEARPGITGSWQVHGRSRTTFDEMVRMDLRYIREQSLWLDIILLLKTPLAVLRGEGAH